MRTLFLFALFGASLSASAGFRPGDEVEFRQHFTGRQSPYLNSDIVVDAIPPGTKAVIIPETSPHYAGFADGIRYRNGKPYSIKLKITEGPYQGKELWIRYQDRNIVATGNRLQESVEEQFTEEVKQDQAKTALGEDAESDDEEVIRETKEVILFDNPTTGRKKRRGQDYVNFRGRDQRDIAIDPISEGTKGDVLERLRLRAGDRLKVKLISGPNKGAIVYVYQSHRGSNTFTVRRVTTEKRVNAEVKQSPLPDSKAVVEDKPVDPIASSPPASPHIRRTQPVETEPEESLANKPNYDRVPGIVLEAIRKAIGVAGKSKVEDDPDLTPKQEEERIKREFSEREIQDRSQCKEEFVSEIPFFVSSRTPGGSITEDHVYENIRESKTGGNPHGYLPSGSIVQVDEEWREKVGKVGGAVPVQVVSVPGEESMLTRSQVTAGERRGKVAQGRYTSNGKPRAKAGDRGFVYDKSLKRVGKSFGFIVNHSTLLMFMTPKGKSLPVFAGSALLPVMNSAGKYKVQKCCDEKRCRFDPIFKVARTADEIKSPKARDEVILASPPICSANVMESLRPVRMEDIESLMTFGQAARDEQLLMYDGKSFSEHDLLQYVASNGRMRIPFDQETWEGPYHSYHHRANEPDASAVGIDAFMPPNSACAFMSVLRNWRIDQGWDSRDYEIQWGDAGHGVYSSLRDHQSHGSGQCIDIRPIPKDANYRGGLTYRESDLSRTKKLIDFMVEAGGSSILYNDPKVYRNNRNVRYQAKHDDHIHVCFQERSPKVIEACSRYRSEVERDRN